MIGRSSAWFSGRGASAFGQGTVWRVALVGVVVAAALPQAARAQSFDCAKARAPVETAICASNELRTLDNAVAGAYARAQYAAREDAAAIAALRADQRAFLTARARACAAPTGLEACLARLYRARRAVLTDAPSAPLADGADPARAERARAELAAPPQVAPAMNVLPPARAPAPTPSVAITPPEVRADAHASALVAIPAPGRYRLRVESRTGVALQMVDMIAGPGEKTGAAGVRDGRVDLLLDAGVYKARTFGAAGAGGMARLVAEPFQEILRVASLGAPAVGELRDLQTIAFEVEPRGDGPMVIEAIGRAVSDLRVWRDGALVDAQPEIAVVEPRAGRAMTRARLSGVLEPGRYVATVYGGPPQVWAEGGDASPLMVRAAPPLSLAMGAYAGVLGPFGAASFETAAEVDYIRLDSPEPADVQMTLRRKGAPSQVVSLARTNRDPFIVATPQGGEGPVSIEVSGREGQPFRLRAFRRGESLALSGEGPALAFVDVAGEGGDEMPATAVLARVDRGRATALAAETPKVGQGAAWRRRFNLRGPSAVIFEVTGAGPIAIATQGRVAQASVEPTFGGQPASVRPESKTTYDLDPGFYTLRLAPPDNGAGVVEVTLGPPGLRPERETSPPRTTLALGRVTFEKGVSYEARVNAGPLLAAGVRVVPLPADLAKGPLALWQGPPAAPPSAPRLNETAPRPIKTTAPADALPKAAQNQPRPKPSGAPTLSPAPPSAKPPAKPSGVGVARPALSTVPAAAAPTVRSGEPMLLRARAPLGGRILALDDHGAEWLVTLEDERREKDGRTFALRLPASAAPRALAVVWRPDPPAPKSAQSAPQAALTADAPVFFDLARDQSRAFRLETAAGGLYRVETMGRLAAKVTIGADLLPRLAEAAENGAGHNALAQTYLRAGRYRVTAAALQGSSGRVGLRVRPAPLQATEPLAPGASVRAALADGAGALIAIAIPAPQEGAPPEGGPPMKADAGRNAQDNARDNVKDDVQERAYRLDLFTPGRPPFMRLEDGEGWPLTPPARARAIDVRLTPGAYRLVVAPDDVDTRVVARLTAAPPVESREGHGPHPLPFDAEQTHQWREPAADAPRAPDVWTFALAGPAQVDLTITEGMIAELVRGDDDRVGKVIATRPFKATLGAGLYRVEARALSRDDRLDYRLSLKADTLQPGVARLVRPPAVAPFALAQDSVVNLTSFGRVDVTGVLKTADGRVVERLASGADWNVAFARVLPAGAYRLDITPTARGAPAAPTGEGEESGAAQPRDAQSADASGDGAAQGVASDDGQVELHLALPVVDEAGALAPVGAMRWDARAGAPAHRVVLPPAPVGALALLVARSTADVAIEVERRDGAGAWRSVGRAQGRAPVVAAPADGAVWRALVWSVAGSPAPIAVASRVIESAPKQTVAFDPFPIPELETTLQVAHLAAPGALAMDLVGEAARVGSAPGRALEEVRAGAYAPQSEHVWFVGETPRAVAVRSLEGVDALALDLEPGARARLPGAPPPTGVARIWVARAGAGQPSLASMPSLASHTSLGSPPGEGGGSGALGPGVAAALAGATATEVWNAGATPARIDLDRRDLTLAPETRLDARLATVLAPLSATPLRLPPGVKRLTFDLGAGAGAFATDGARLAFWADAGPMTRVAVTAARALLLVNPSPSPTPVAVTSAPGAPDAITPDHILRRFHGVAGGLTAPVTAQAGDVLHIGGATATFMSDAGRVTRGERIVVDGPGVVLIEHGPGLVAAWLERDGQSPWPKAAPRPLAPPAETALTGAAAAFALQIAAPGLLRVATTAPVAVMLAQDGRRDFGLYPAGADIQRFVAAGSATVTFYPAGDGPLTGAAMLDLIAPHAAGEGVSPPLALGPGGRALFGFEVSHAREIGIGLRAEPDRAEARLLDAAGAPLAEGVAMLKALPPGRYFVEARAPADTALTARLSLFGLNPPPTAPPQEAIDALRAKTPPDAPAPRSTLP